MKNVKSRLSADSVGILLFDLRMDGDGLCAVRGQFFITGAIVVFLVWGLFAVRTLTGPLIGAP